MENEILSSNAIETAQDEVLLEVKNLKKYFVVGKTFLGKPNAFLKAVDNVSFTLKKGKTLGIVGESGCGKTTMGRTILRLYDVTGGEIIFKGQEVSKLSGREFDKLRPNMQMIFQDPYASLSPRLTVGEIIGEAARQHGLVDKAHFRDYVLEVMKMCGLQPHYFERYPHEFSGGQRQRICIARACVEARARHLRRTRFRARRIHSSTDYQYAQRFAERAGLDLCVHFARSFRC